MLELRAAPDAIVALAPMAGRPIESAEREQIDPVVTIDRPAPFAFGRPFADVAVGAQHKRPFVLPDAAIEVALPGD